MSEWYQLVRIAIGISYLLYILTLIGNYLSNRSVLSLPSQGRGRERRVGIQSRRVKLATTNEEGKATLCAADITIYTHITISPSFDEVTPTHVRTDYGFIRVREALRP